MKQKTCKNCNEIIPEYKRKNSIFCCKSCRIKYNGKNLSRKGRDINLSNGTIGAINELLVSTDLYYKGFNVFRSLSPSCPCDLIVTFDNSLKRVEVRSGLITSNNKLRVTTSNKADLLAVVLQTNQIIYFNPNNCKLEDRFKNTDLIKYLKEWNEK